MYHNEMYNIFNQNYVQEQLRQWNVQQKTKNMQGYHNDQMCKVAECVQKLEDFMKCAEEVSPEYQWTAAVQCWMVLEKYMTKK